MKKLILVGFMAAFAASNATAEKDGFFIAAALPFSGLKITKYTHTSDLSEHTNYDDINYHLGSLGFGYLHALSERLELRYYGYIDLFGIGYSTYNGVLYDLNINANVDALYTIVSGEYAQLRAFAGLWLGFVGEKYDNFIIKDDYSGLDLGANVGLRLVLEQKYAFEFYGHFGFLSRVVERSREGIYGGDAYYYFTHEGVGYPIYKHSQSTPLQIGIRCTFTF